MPVIMIEEWVEVVRMCNMGVWLYGAGGSDVRGLDIGWEEEDSIIALASCLDTGFSFPS
jgi:hypothetical protein